jgi:hypothetical protein
MSVSNDSSGTIDGDGVSLSSTFLEFCAKVRNDDLSILPLPGAPFRIRQLSESEHMELADALLENNTVTYLELETENYSKSSADAMAKYIRTNMRLQRIRWDEERDGEHSCEEMLCCFLPAIQESMSLKELHMELPFVGGSSNQALEHMLTHTQSLRSLTLISPRGLVVEEIAMAAARSGLKKKTTLRELTLEFPLDATTVSPILTSLRDHPLLQRLVLRGNAVALTGLDTVLLSDTSKITELEIRKTWGGPSMRGLTRVLQALARRPTLTKLRLHCFPLGDDEARQLAIVLRKTPSLQTLALTEISPGSAGLA